MSKDRHAGKWEPEETLEVAHPDSLHGNAKNLTGEPYGRLTPILPTTMRYGNEILWVLHCRCGTWTVQPTSKIANGDTVSCGCYNRDQASRMGKEYAGQNRLDLTGQRFGKLVAVEPTDDRHGHSVIWRCKCDCGNESLVSAGNLRSEHTRSCGCLARGGPEEWLAHMEEGEGDDGSH